eukprot:COSAG04_NODE_1543_length_6408_cov_131.251862_9_plen_50_part_01
MTGSGDAAGGASLPAASDGWGESRTPSTGCGAAAGMAAGRAAGRAAVPAA